MGEQLLNYAFGDINMSKIRGAKLCSKISNVFKALVETNLMKVLHAILHFYRWYIEKEF